MYISCRTFSKIIFNHILYRVLSRSFSYINSNIRATSLCVYVCIAIMPVYFERFTLFKVFPWQVLLLSFMHHTSLFKFKWNLCALNIQYGQFTFFRIYMQNTSKFKFHSIYMYTYLHTCVCIRTFVWLSCDSGRCIAWRFKLGNCPIYMHILCLTVLMLVLAGLEWSWFIINSTCAYLFHL